MIGTENPEVEKGFVFAYLYQGRADDALAQIEKYLELVPNDESMKKMMDGMRSGIAKVHYEN